MSDPTHLYTTVDFQAAVNACGRTRMALAAAVAPALGNSASTVQNLLTPGHRIPVNAGRNTIVDALCREINFPVERALTHARPRTPRAAAIEVRFEAARAAIRAQRRRLSDEDIYSRRSRSPFGVPDKDEEAA